MTLASRTQCKSVAKILVAFVAIGSVWLFAAQPDNTRCAPLPMSTESVSGPKDRRLPTYLRWKGREYDIEAGIGLLMGVVRGSEESHHPWNADTALVELASLETQLRGRPCLGELLKLYDTAGELKKRMILTCFRTSLDPRGLPLFSRTLDTQENMRLRLSAAAGLAKWNIRRGVAELVNLIDSKDVLRPPPPPRMPYARDYALQLFRTNSAFKGWGFPDEEIRKSIEARPGLDREQFVALYRAEIKKWFAANEHRFPQWRSGDPLPKVLEDEGQLQKNK